MANMNLASEWTDPALLIEHLGGELFRGRLAIFLGAGLSMGFDLPDWYHLVKAICERVSEPVPAKTDNLTVVMAALKLKHFERRESDFLKLVQDCLYHGKDVSFNALRKNDLVAAIGALVMASQRGSASAVITLNFDDLLERYLEFHGLLVRPEWREFHWASNDDVRIYHPHGLLPADDSRPPSTSIVFDVRDFHKIVSGGSHWRPLLETILRTHTTLYIGLSGDDQHLQSLLNDLGNKHAIQNDRFAYHGVRFGTKPPKDLDLVLDRMGIFNHLFDSHEELPKFLFEICQSARKRRVAKSA